MDRFAVQMLLHQVRLWGNSGTAPPDGGRVVLWTGNEARQEIYFFFIFYYSVLLHKKEHKH